ncbi:MAG: hypothetical protein HQ582_23090 [Planctomycetes bacterium]|nr:hypothetical protein [Planctomycetota bacterium]
MWPTSDSLPLLLAGLLPLAYVAYVVSRRGLGEFMSLGCIGTLFMWGGYHLSPWLCYWSGLWSNSVLVEDYVDDGLAFSTWCILAFIAGYEYLMGKQQSSQIDGATIEAMLPPVQTKWLVGLSILTLVMFVIRAEGFAEAWQSSVARGVNNWREIRTVADRVYQLTALLYPVSALCLSTVASIYVLQAQSHDLIKRCAFGLFCLIVASVEGLWSFSRDAGCPFLIFSFVALTLRGRRAVVLAVPCALIILCLGGIGRNYRQVYNPGLGNFMAAAIHGNQEEISDQDGPLLTANLNPLSAIEAWSLKASLVESDRLAGCGDAVSLLWNLHPFPSLLVPTCQIGQDLTEVMGTVGSSGVTTPALAELFHAFGNWGILLMIPVGMVYAWFEGMSRRKPTVVSFLCLVLCFASFPVGLHNGVRAMSRLPVYALLLYLIHGRLSASSARDDAAEGGCSIPHPSVIRRPSGSISLER